MWEAGFRIQKRPLDSDQHILNHTQEDPGTPINQSSEEEVADCSTDEDPKDPDDDDSSENDIDLNLVYRPHFRRSLLLRSHQSEAERVTPQDGGERRMISAYRS